MRTLGSPNPIFNLYKNLSFIPKVTYSLPTPARL